VKVFGSTGSGWNVSSDYGGDGCTSNNQWLPATYIPVPNPSDSYTFTGSIIVRSVHDPYIIADHLTGGSFYFQQDADNQITLGIIISIVGAGIIIPTVALSYFAYRSFVRKHQLHRRFDGHYDIPKSYGRFS